MEDNIFENLSTSVDDRQWDTLIDKIIEGEVVPVIGPDFLAQEVTDLEKWMNPHQKLIDMIAVGIIRQGQDHLQHKSFSELLYDDAFPASKRKNIYAMIGAAFEREIMMLNENGTPDKRIFSPSCLLLKLLKICQFRFVITTSFTPMVEYAMKELYGYGNVNVLNFNNNPSNNDDIKDPNDIYKPTVYYMFGRVCRHENKYVVTDSDMLSFCSSWFRNAPQTLVNVLKNKYLLFLGNNYSDWLCRFVWYSMKTELDTKLKGMIVNPLADDNLLQFMKRIDAFTEKDPKTVIEKIETLVTDRMKSQDKFKKPGIRTDVFISYSRRDADVVEKLYDALTKKGLRVWYDKKNLGVGSKFMEDIKWAIKTTKIFVPVFSHHVEEEKNDSHPYRTEWDTAMELATTFGRSFIYPICENNFDFYNGCIPDKLQGHNAMFFDYKNPDFSVFADNVFNSLMTL